MSPHCSELPLFQFETLRPDNWIETGNRNCFQADISSEEIEPSTAETIVASGPGLTSDSSDRPPMVNAPTSGNQPMAPR